MTTPRPITLTGLDHVVFLVDDMAKALEFYTGFLGCPQGFSYPALGMEQVWAGTELIVLWDTTHEGGKDAQGPVKGGRNVHHVCIATLPFDQRAFRQYCAEHGVEITREAVHGGARGMGHSFYITDPFDNIIEIKGPPEYPDGTA